MNDARERILEVNNLHVSFETYLGEIKAVRGVSFYVNKGETLGVVGESGCGKSVTMQTIMKLMPMPPAKIKSGSIIYKGQDITDYDDEQMRFLRGKEMSMIFQDPLTSLNPIRKIGKQVTEVLFEHEEINKKEAEERAMEMMRLVGIPNPELNMIRYPHTYSGGMRQRIMIAIAMIAQPSIVFADEPTTALDVTMQIQILELMNNMKEKLGSSIVLITHDLGVIAHMAERVAVMYAGEIVETGTVEDIFYNSMHPYTWGLLDSIPDVAVSKNTQLYSIPGSPPDLLSLPKGCGFAPRCRYCMKICKELKPPVTEIEKGHSVKCWLTDERAPKVDYLKVKKNSDQKVHVKVDIKDNDTSKVSVDVKVTNSKPSDKKACKVSDNGSSPILVVKDLKKYFPMKKEKVLKAVDDVSFSIEKGKTLGLVGESGCGKSTVGRTVLGLYDKTGGDVYFDGINVHEAGSKEYKELTKKMQIIFQDPYSSLNPRFTVRDIIAEGLKVHKMCSTKKELDEKVYEMFELVGLNKDHINRYPHEFSGGQRQRISIARALVLNPEFIVCDEATSALDVSIQAQIINLLKKLQQDLGLTYLFIAHNLAVVRYISDEVAVMYMGNIVEIGETEDVFKNPVHPYTKGLLDATLSADPKYEKRRNRVFLKGEVQGAFDDIGCRFYPRCSIATSECKSVKPISRDIGNGHIVACHNI